MHTYVYCTLFTIAKTWNQPKCPSMIDWTGKMWHTYIMKYYVAIKKWGVHVLFRDMDQSGNHHSQQTTQEQEIKHHMVSLISGCWTMRTHGHREWSITHWGLLGGNKGGTACGGELGRDSMRRNARYRWWGGRQQITLPCVHQCNNLACFFTCTTKRKMQ